eukprot:m.92335 g.92335  ORF g.92335 m.92335 type:complete len:261 (-) comp15065_c0_seq5:49-831(-)
MDERLAKRLEELEAELPEHDGDDGFDDEHKNDTLETWGERARGVCVARSRDNSIRSILGRMEIHGGQATWKVQVRSHHARARSYLLGLVKRHCLVADETGLSVFCLILRLWGVNARASCSWVLVPLGLHLFAFCLGQILHRSGNIAVGVAPVGTQLSPSETAWRKLPGFMGDEYLMELQLQQMSNGDVLTVELDHDAHTVAFYHNTKEPERPRAVLNNLPDVPLRLIVTMYTSEGGISGSKVALIQSPSDLPTKSAAKVS